MEKSFQKYENLTKEEGANIKSVAAKVTIKGIGEFPAGGAGGTMPINLDAVVEIAFKNPGNYFFDVSGNLGNAKVFSTEKEKGTATIILPGTRQFAVIKMPQQITNQTQEKPEEPSKMDQFFNTMELQHLGMEKTKAGQAHKILIKNKDPKEKATITAYILDGKWDPARFDINSEGQEGNAIVVEFEKLEWNRNIPDNKFVPDTSEYVKVTDQQITAAVMMQIMTSMMQQNQGQ